MRSTAPEGPKGGFVYVLDITPFVRHFPTEVQLGLDPGLAAPTPRKFPRSFDAHVDEPLPHPPNSSVPGPMTPWEAWAFEMCSNSTWPPTPCSPRSSDRFYSVSAHSKYHPSYYEQLFEKRADDIWCNPNLPPPRWHRVHSLGLHFEQFADGLELVSAPPTWKSSALVEDIDAEVAAGRFERTSWTHEPFIGTGEWVVEREGKRTFTVPFLTANPALTAQEASDSVQGTHSIPVGYAGTYGELGVPSILLFGGNMGGAFMGGQYLLEVFFTVPPHAIQNWTDADANREGLTNSSFSASLDQFLTPWGGWSDVGHIPGRSPKTAYGPASTEIPVPEPLLHPSAAVPGGILEPNTTATLFQHSTSNVHLPSACEGWPSSTNDLHYISESGRAALQTAKENYIAAVKAGAFGSHSGGWSLAFFTPAGFARWPDEALAIADEISKDRKTETLMAVVGGCTQQRTRTLEYIGCM